MNKFAIVALLMVGCSGGTGPQGDAGTPHPTMDAGNRHPVPSMDAGSVTPPSNEDAGSVTPPSSMDAGNPSCLADSVVCTSTPNACCSGFCISSASDPSEPAICSAACTTGSECESGCCAPINSNQSVCSGIGFCANTCKAPGDSCTLPEDCCTDNGVPQQCVGVTGGASTCASECTSNADCVSGCCTPLTNLGVSVCAAVQFCG